jgi:predicted regulator of Ras-like GTPase activity (Roadblock/LC7/MglB family)
VNTAAEAAAIEVLGVVAAMIVAKDAVAIAARVAGARDVAAAECVEAVPAAVARYAASALTSR